MSTLSAFLDLKLKAEEGFVQDSRLPSLETGTKNHQAPPNLKILIQHLKNRDEPIDDQKLRELILKLGVRLDTVLEERFEVQSPEYSSVFFVAEQGQLLINVLIKSRYWNEETIECCLKYVEENNESVLKACVNVRRFNLYCLSRRSLSLEMNLIYFLQSIAEENLTNLPGLSNSQNLIIKGLILDINEVKWNVFFDLLQKEKNSLTVLAVLLSEFPEDDVSKPEFKDGDFVKSLTHYYASGANEAEKAKVKRFLLVNNFIDVLCACSKCSIEEAIQAKLHLYASEEIFVDPDYVLNFIRREFKQLFESLELIAKTSKLTERTLNFHIPTLEVPAFFQALLLVMIYRQQSLHNSQSYKAVLNLVTSHKVFATLNISKNYFVKAVELLFFKEICIVKQKNVLAYYFSALVFFLTNAEDLLVLGNLCLNRKGLFPKLLKMPTMHVTNDSNNGESTWYFLFDQVVKQTFKNLNSPFVQAKELTELIERLKIFEKNSIEIPEQILDFSRKFVRFQGRTVLFEGGEDGQFLALKFQKKNEPALELYKQLETVKLLRAHKERWGLRSEIPIPLEVIKIKLIDLKKFLDTTLNIPFELKKDFLSMIEQSDEYIVMYRYKASKNYFIYLHDVEMTFDEFTKAVFDSVHDLLTLLNKGLTFDRLADLYHTRSDGDRAFLVLTNLFCGGRGTGRLHDWMGAIRYINIRKSGLGDEGDWNPVQELLHVEKSATGVASRLTEPDKISFFKNIAEYIAGILLVIELAGGYRTVKTFSLNDIKEKKEFKEQSWLKLNEMLQGLYKFVTKQLAEIFKVQMNGDLINDNSTVKMIFQQAFWMDKEVYVPHFLKNEIPKNLYGPETEVFVNLSMEIRDGNITPERGYTPDELESLGIVNGTYPIDDRMHFAVPLCPMWAAARRDTVEVFARKCVEKILVKRRLKGS